MTTPLEPSDFSSQPPSANDRSLEDLAALTGLFNPALLVDELQELDAADAATDVTPPAPEPEQPA